MPAVAIVFQLLVSNLLLLTQSFEAVLDFIQFSLAFCSFFTVLGVIKMRITHPNLLRPYRAWGYPLTPLVFLTVTLFVMYYLIVSRPLQSLGGVAMMLAGLVIYYASRLLSNVPSSDVSRTVPLKADVLTVHKFIAVALLAGVLALTTAPARSAETASTRRYRALPCRPAACTDSPLAALTNDPQWAAARALISIPFSRKRIGPPCPRSALSPQRGLISINNTMLYMFSGPDFLYATIVFPACHDLRVQRP